MGYATFHTPQLDRMIDYYLNVIGLILVSRDAGGAFLAARTGLLAVELLNGPQPDCAALAFEVGSDQEFETADSRPRVSSASCVVIPRRVLPDRSPSRTTTVQQSSCSKAGSRRASVGRYAELARSSWVTLLSIPRMRRRPATSM
jgi:hypothetical protein